MAPPQGADECGGETGEHGDVQPRNAHQVIHAGARERLPLIDRYRALVANGKCDRDAGIRTLREGGEDAVAQRAAQRLDGISGRGHERGQPLGAARSHDAGGAYAPFQQIGLEIVAVRIDHAVRRLSRTV